MQKRQILDSIFTQNIDCDLDFFISFFIHHSDKIRKESVIYFLNLRTTLSISVNNNKCAYIFDIILILHISCIIKLKSKGTNE